MQDTETIAQTALRQLEAQLHQREKELACLYALSDLIEQPGISLDAILEGAVRLLPPACQFPEIAGARIVLDDQEFRTETYRETEWRMSTHLIVFGQRSGQVEVCYREPGPWGAEGPFLEGERALLVAVAQRLWRTIERLQAEERFRAQRQLLDLIIDSVPAYITYIDADYTILHANRAIAEWWGYSKEQTVGKTSGR
jgi:PAS domain-containing protein